MGRGRERSSAEASSGRPPARAQCILLVNQLSGPGRCQAGLKFSSYTSILGDIRLWVGVPRASYALVVPSLSLSLGDLNPFGSLRSPPSAQPTETAVESGTSQSKSGTSVNLSNSGMQVLEMLTGAAPFADFSKAAVPALSQRAVVPLQFLRRGCTSHLLASKLAARLAGR